LKGRSKTLGETVFEDEDDDEDEYEYEARRFPQLLIRKKSGKKSG
jgi:hypothetical protein